MRRAAAGIPIQKEARPMVVMHRYCRARRRHGDFEYAYERVFEDHFVAGGGLHGVVTVGEIRFVFSVDIEIPSEQYKRAHGQDGDES
jgi:hypothetical protein